MTENYLKNITPDSFSGLIFGFEGIKKSVVLLNGPTGCKFYHGATSDNQLMRQDEFDPTNYSDQWCFGQPRVPCTYLDKRDYVYGSKDKLTEILDYLTKEEHRELLVIVNSPGASLIGDDLKSIAADAKTRIPVVTVETPGYSQYIWDGYYRACEALVEQLLPSEVSTTDSSSGKRKRVNILGLSIFQKYYEGSLAEITRLLDLCDIDVNCSLCCECTVEEIRNLPQADLNLVVDPVYGLKIANFLKEKYGTPYVCAEGLPVGFYAMEQLISNVCHMLDCDDHKLLIENEKARARAYLHMSRINSLTGLPKGAKFAVHGTSSQCLGYARFLIEYFGMAADSICALDREKDYETLSAFLSSYGMEDALEKNIFHTSAELVFADGNIIGILKAKQHQFSGVEIALPTMGYIDVIPKTHWGLSGGLLLCEQVINGLMF